MDKRILTGHYAKEQLLSRSALISYSHRSRFQTALKLVAPFAGSHLLDYGCGDGTFIAMVQDLFPKITGADLDQKALDRSRERLADLPGVEFRHVRDLADSSFEKAFPLITCMETLEHCPANDVTDILRLFSRLLAPGGTLLISVPIEIGPTLIAKQAVRALAGLRGIGDYQHRERYTLDELRTMVLADEDSAIVRPTYFANGSHYHGHKGFNWRALRRELGQSFDVVDTSFSPFPMTRGFASSQAWLTCRQRS